MHLVPGDPIFAGWAPGGAFAPWRLAERRVEVFRRAWENPDRPATRAEDVPRPLGILLGLLKVAVLAGGAQLVWRTAQRAFPAGS